ncbi:hypothetical protein GMOD_00006219 [Pyrenophora seminiperda CCB06]|uniref:Uncharacterized protein n=1 Tax=Pyrenophora seminiperda CCB06 TaxID=1302712 RepID=A0A3M7M4G9_9PLEO|nr:hypothetical protein GMOD_00006219 [Pyrenophora seminiperda CCB06]
MADQIIILRSSSYERQMTQIENYVLKHMVTAKFAGRHLEFLPCSAMAALATVGNIGAVVEQDPELLKRYFPSHSVNFFTNRIAKEAKRMFIVAAAERLGMDFLRILMREHLTADEYLPLPHGFRIRDENNVFWDDKGLDGFLEAQRMVCAPVFNAWKCDQNAAFADALPIVEAKKMESEDEEIWQVRFHKDHLFGFPEGQIWEKKWFILKMFEDLEEARKDSRWEKKMFGFTCEDTYYLVGLR